MLDIFYQEFVTKIFYDQNCHTIVRFSSSPVDILSMLFYT